MDELLDVSRIGRGEFALQVEEFDLVQLVEEIVERERHAADAAGTPIRIDARGAIRGRWDRFRLDQLIANLLGNALKYAPGKPVDISLRQHADEVELSMIDRGIGISGEDLTRIFGRFERAVSMRHNPAPSRYAIEDCGRVLTGRKEIARWCPYWVEIRHLSKQSSLDSPWGRPLGP